MPDDDTKANRGNRSATSQARVETRGGAPARRGNARDKQEGYSKTTRNVCVTVRSFYLADKSEPDENHFVWAYRVKIENHGANPCSCCAAPGRSPMRAAAPSTCTVPAWSANNPLLEPGESFEYTSGTPLDTPSGFMMGAYHMVLPSSGENFDVAIPAFSLDSPHQSGRVH